MALHMKYEIAPFKNDECLGIRQGLSYIWTLYFHSDPLKSKTPALKTWVSTHTVPYLLAKISAFLGAWMSFVIVGTDGYGLGLEKHLQHKHK